MSPIGSNALVKKKSIKKVVDLFVSVAAGKALTSDNSSSYMELQPAGTCIRESQFFGSLKSIDLKSCKITEVCADQSLFWKPTNGLGSFLVNFS